ncbi:hypothetical protein D9Q98_001067 [Chlorella vulgaris]|uniref:SGNH hydrolase-type esterase domain-containing protein n=1 Tax=Chlorella vulgaris TaxID=3077 RepID=A0A9D4TZW7_CHLVU|nr:hypothetical protein D9Q98_001067 [Chlorella vulgaris]
MDAAQGPAMVTIGCALHLLFIALTCIACSQASAVITHTTVMRPQFVTFGDSITQRGFEPGWGSLLANAYQRRADVVSRGYSGYNSRWALQLLDAVFPQPSAAAPPPRLATVFFGANDAALPDRGSARQHVPLAEFKGNLRAIVQHLHRIGVPAVVLITPPPISEPDRITHVLQTYGVHLEEPERTNEVAGQYAAAVEEVGAELGLPCLNLWQAFQAEQDWQHRLLSDGLHLTAEGNACLYRLLQQLIDQRFPALRVAALPMDAPDHSDIDPTNVQAAFDKHFSRRGGSREEL